MRLILDTIGIGEVKFDCVARVGRREAGKEADWLAGWLADYLAVRVVA